MFTRHTEVFEVLRSKCQDASSLGKKRYLLVYLYNINFDHNLMLVPKKSKEGL